jgi:threonine-phosphate decarboxylase
MNDKHGGRLEDLSEQYGIASEKIIDFSVNVNPLGPPKSLMEILRDKLSLIIRYPDTESRYLRRKLAEHPGLSYENIAIGNGSNELIYLIFRAYPKPKVLIIHPTYSEYGRGAEAGGSNVSEFILRWQDGFNLDMDLLIREACKHDFVFLCNPNNPTGHLFKKEAILKLVSSIPQTIFVIDEAFMYFVSNRSEYQVVSDIMNFPNLVVLRSMTKFFAIPGLRLGYLVADTEIIGKLNQYKEPWSVNVLAQLAGEHLLDQEDYSRKTLQLIQEELSFLVNELSQLNWLHIYPSEANFMLIRITTDKLDSTELCERLMSDGIAIRNCSNFVGLDNKFFRIAVKNRPENQRLIEALQNVERDLA